MSSKKIPYIVDWMGAPSFFVFTSIVNWAHELSAVPMTTAIANILFFIQVIVLFNIIVIFIPPNEGRHHCDEQGQHP